MFNLRKNKSQISESVEHDENLKMSITVENIKNILSSSDDVMFRTININRNEKLSVTLVYVNGLVDNKNISDYIIKPLMSSNTRISGDIIQFVEKNIIYYNTQASILEDVGCLINDIMNGSVGIIFDSNKKALSFDVKGFQSRAITEPTGEIVIKGSKDSFTEVMAVNTATLRRKIRTHNLTVEILTLGRQSLTSLSIVYLKNIANPRIVEELKARLHKINTDCIIGSGMIEENIIDNKYSIVPQIHFTERPDTLAKYLVDGYVGLIIEGSPNVIIAPSTINCFLKSSDDYSQNYIVASMIRLLRYFCTLTSAFLPSIYVALTSFHQEMIPPELLTSMQRSKEGVPLPTFFELLFMLVAFEILLEGGLRLPKNIGQTISIVGALVIGQAAVSANIISPVIVIIVSLTGIAGFVIPSQDFSNSVRVIRLFSIFFASLYGLFGFTFILLIIGIHLCSIESFGVPILSPFVANELDEIHDTFFRAPHKFLNFRESYLKTINKRRQSNRGG